MESHLAESKGCPIPRLRILILLNYNQIIPLPNFIEESFLQNVRGRLPRQGNFPINQFLYSLHCKGHLLAHKLGLPVVRSICLVQNSHDFEKQVKVIHIADFTQEKLLLDQSAQVGLHLLRVCTNEIASFGCLFDVLGLELGDNADDSATVAHGRVRLDMLAVKKPVAHCRRIGKIFRDVGEFFWDGNGLDIEKGANNILERFRHKATMTEILTDNGECV